MSYQTKFWHLFTGLFPILTVLLTVGVVVVGIRPAFADLCMQDSYQQNGLNKQSLNCTANDVRIAAAENIRDLAGDPLTQCISGQSFSFIADFRVVLTAQDRYDIGLYFATDGDGNGDGALTGVCEASIITKRTELLGSENFVQLDPSPPDFCGDIDSDNNPQLVGVQVNDATCIDTDGDGNVNLPNCTSWRQPGANETCVDESDAFPGSPSKCNCDLAFNIPVFVETASITVEKSAAPPSLPEPGGEFTYTVETTNDMQFTDVELNSICDDRFGEVVKTAAAPACPPGDLGTVKSTDCIVPQTVTPGATYSCDFTADVTSNTPTTETDTVTVFGVDTTGKAHQDSDSAMVSITDIPPTAQVIKSLDDTLCATVRYKVEVRNTSFADILTLNSLNDSSFGNLMDQNNSKLVDTTCDDLSGDTLDSNDGQPGGSDETFCTFDTQICGATTHVNQVTGGLTDEEGGSTSPMSNSLTIEIKDAVITP